MLKPPEKILLYSSNLWYLSAGMLGPLIAVFTEQVGGSLLDISWAWAIYLIFTGLFIIITGKISDKILGKEKQKKSFVKKEINLKSKKPNGLLLIKEIFNDASKKAEINYIAAGKYSLKVESINLKKADQELQELIKEIERKSKKLGLEFSEKAKK